MLTSYPCITAFEKQKQGHKPSCNWCHRHCQRCIHLSTVVCCEFHKLICKDFYKAFSSVQLPEYPTVTAPVGSKDLAHVKGTVLSAKPGLLLGMDVSFMTPSVLSQIQYTVITACFTQMAGGHALSRRLSEAAALDEAKAAKLQAQHEAEQEAALQRKRKDAQQQQQLLMRTRQQQVAPLATAYG